MLTTLREDIDTYVKNKKWYVYLPFWIFGFYLFVKLLDFKLGEPSPSFFISIAQSFNFFLHEIAHLLTGFLPFILTAAAGSGAELLLGLGLIVTAFIVRSYFASLFCFLWFMLATQATADYMADARSQALALVSFGGSDPIHDWNYIFGKIGMLENDMVIAGIVRVIGIGAAVVGLFFSGWLIFRIALAKADAAHQAEVDALMNKITNAPPNERANTPFVKNELYPSAQKGQLAEHESIHTKKQAH